MHISPRALLAVAAGALAPVLAAPGVHAQPTLEVVTLRNRPAEQVIPILRPLVEPGGAISGQGFQLILRVSPRNLQDLKSALAAIDSPQRQLVISVRFDDAAGHRAAGVVSTRTDGVDQRVQVLEGGRAFISTGHSRPLQDYTVVSGPRRAIVATDTVIQELETGFEVVPRVSGDRVFLDIHPRRDRPSLQGPGSIDSQQVATSVSGRMGEWIELGGSSSSAVRTEPGMVSSASAGRSSTHSADRRIWVRVEASQR